MPSEKMNIRPGQQKPFLAVRRASKVQNGAGKQLSRLCWVLASVLVFVAAGLGLLGCSEDQSENKTQASTNAVPLEDVQGSEGERAFDPQTVLATVNGEEIRLKDLQGVLSSLSEGQQKAYAKSRHELLETMIIRAVLVQEAERLQIQPEGRKSSIEKGNGTAASGIRQEDLIQALFEQEVLKEVSVREADLRRFYEENKEQMPADSTFAEIKEQLRPYVLRMEQQKAVKAYIDDLLQQAKVSKNQDWIAAQKDKSADNPLARALESGRPVLADFGKGSCIPCKMMQPILEELQKKYQGRAEILILDVREYPHLTREYSIRTIPTQIFFDASGQQVKRHVGFMSKEDIVSVLQELKVAAN